MDLHWELSVLSRCVAFSNLSTAAGHVGLSQPQLSRIVSRLETNLGIVILDRSARRKSGWTALAFRLATLYSKAQRHLERDLQKIIHDSEPNQFRVGTLEGLVPLVSKFGKKFFDTVSIKILEIDVHDLNELEEFFFRGDFDLIFISKAPGMKKFKHSKILGYQTLERYGEKGGVDLMSSFEFGIFHASTRHQVDKSRRVVSNSLEVRKLWLKDNGGSGIIPSPVKEKSAGRGTQEVIMIGSDLLSPDLWRKILNATGD